MDKQSKNPSVLLLLTIFGIIIFLALGLHSANTVASPQGVSAKIVVDLDKFELRYYDDSGELRLKSIATGGAQWCDDTQSTCKTPAGAYRIGEKYDANYRSKSYPVDCYSGGRKGNDSNGQPCGAKMPFYMEISKRHSFGIHGGFVPREPLAHVTHACIRIPWETAQELSEIVPKGTLVIILPYTPQTPDISPLHQTRE